MSPDDRKTLEDALKDPAQASKHDRIRAKLKQADAAAPPEVAAKRKALTYEEQLARTHSPDEGNRADFLPAPPPRQGTLEALAEGFGSMVSQSPAAAFIRAPSGERLSAAGKAFKSGLTDEVRLRQQVRGLDDAVMLGYGAKIADKLNEAVGRTPGFRLTEESDQAQDPGDRMAGQISGSFLPGASNLLGKAGGAAVRPVVQKVAPGLPGAVEGIAGYELTAPAAAFLDASSAGDRAGAAKAAATDPLALILSGAAGWLGKAGRSKARDIRDPRTESGQLINEVDRAKGTIHAFGDEPVSGGLYESPELKGRIPGRQATNDLADDSVGRMVAANRGRVADARTNVRDKIDDMISQRSNKPYPSSPVHTVLDTLEAENTVNGVTVDPGVKNGLDKVRAMLTQTVEGVDEDATLAAMKQKLGLKPEDKLQPAARQALLDQARDLAVTVPVSAQQVSALDLVKARKAVRQLANSAATPSENRVYQKILGSMDEVAELVDPRIKGMNKAFSSAMEPVENVNDMLFGKKAKDVDFTEAERATAVGRMGRIGDDTQAATIRHLDERLSAQGAEYAREVDLMRARKAQERLRRGPPETSTAIEKTLTTPKSRYSGTIVGTLLGGPIGAAIGLAADKYKENPLANRVRLALPASEAAGKVSGGGAGLRVDLAGNAARKRAKKKQNNEKEAP